MDWLVLAAYGVLMTAVILQVSASGHRMFELGLGLVLSLSPVGLV